MDRTGLIKSDSPPLSMGDKFEELDDAYFEEAEASTPSPEELHAFLTFLGTNDVTEAEAYFCPEEWHYPFVLDHVNETDIIWDIGAGDCRLDLLLAQKVKHVYAIEIVPDHLIRALKILNLAKPPNLTLIWGNGFTLPIPAEVTKVICLMIHREHEFHTSIAGKELIVADEQEISVVKM